MVAHRVAGAPLDFAASRAESAVTGDFASEVHSLAHEAARRVGLPHEDATDIPFAAVDLTAEHSATITLDEPAVRARCAGDHVTVGERIRARLTMADVAARTVTSAATG